MVRIGYISIAIVLALSILLPGCSDSDVDPYTTTYDTIEEQSSDIGSEGGQVQLGDGANVVIPPGAVNETVTFTLSRKSAQGELPSSIEEDPDSTLISDFYFLEVDKVLDQEHQITLEFPSESSVPSDQIRVIEVINVEGEACVHFVDAIVNESSQRVIITDVRFFPTSLAVQEYEAEYSPGGCDGFQEISISRAYAAISDTQQSNQTFSGASIQPLQDHIWCNHIERWGRMWCIGERAEVLIMPVCGYDYDMAIYACNALQFAERIQNAYTEAGFDTHDTVIVIITTTIVLKFPVGSSGGKTRIGSDTIHISNECQTGEGSRLNAVINHEIAHTVQSKGIPYWWQESSADWMAYYFEPYEEARTLLGLNVLSLALGSENPYSEPFPWSEAAYDYDPLIDFLVESSYVSLGSFVRFINEGYDPTDTFMLYYRWSADEFAQYLAETSRAAHLSLVPDVEHEFDASNSGSIVLSIDVSPLTLPFMYIHPKAGTGRATFEISLQTSTNAGGVVVGSGSEPFVGSVSAGSTFLRVTEASNQLFMLPFALGTDSAELELMVSWEPWPPDEVTLSILSSEGGSVTTPGENTYPYPFGTIVDLVATADPGYYFVEWTGTNVDTIANVYAASTTITMNGDYSITANFEEEGGEEPVYIPDPNLEAAIREAIGKPTGPILREDLEGLTSLNAQECNIADLTGMEYCTNLTLLFLYDNQISDISPLSGLTNLTYLQLVSNQISDISPLSGLTGLTRLYLQDNQISDISPLSGLTGLEFLYLWGNNISDISPLSGLTSLTDLYLYSNQISDISPLSGLTSLTRLHLGWNQISDISPLSGLTNLTLLVLHYNQISDISPLSGLTSLTYLHLSGNQISDISPLSGLTSLTDLYLYSNQISDISPLSGLTGLTYLHLYNNQISDISPLVNNPGLGEGDVVHLENNPLSSDSINIYIPELEARGVDVDY